MWRKTIGKAGRLWGVEKSTVYIDGAKYLTRWILYVGFGTLRLHKFWRGDDDRASHTHPWWFITIPFASYGEYLFEKGLVRQQSARWPHGPVVRIVRAWRPHFRRATFEHRVIGRLRQEARLLWYVDPRPFYTLVITGPRTNAWGFYPEPDKFVPWRDYK